MEPWVAKKRVMMDMRLSVVEKGGGGLWKGQLAKGRRMLVRQEANKPPVGTRYCLACISPDDLKQ